MNNAMGIIYTSKDSLALRELTSYRAVAALPFAASYRIIDFILSSLVNSGVRNIGVITHSNYRSLMDHLGSGQEWDLHTRNNGLFILPPFQTTEDGGDYEGVLDALRLNFGYLRRSKQDYVILTNSDTVLNMDLEPMMEQHLRTGADITLMYAKVGANTMDLSSPNRNGHSYIRLSDEGDILEMEVNPNAASFDNILMDVVIIKRTLLIHLVDRAFARGMVDFNADLIRSIIGTQELSVKGYEFKGYWRKIETVRGYFNASMDLLDPQIRGEIFGSSPIRTKTRDDVPAIYRKGAQVHNSLVGIGCVIEGTVENSILFRGVSVKSGVHIKNCIIMQDTYIGANVELENVILDKEVTIRDNGRLIGDKQYPIVIGKNVTL